MVRIFFDALTKNQANVSERKRADAVYGFLSTAAHPTLFRVREIRHYLAEPRATELRTEVEQARQPVLMTSMLFYGCSLFVNYFGFPPDRCDEFADHIDRVIPGAIAD